MGTRLSIFRECICALVVNELLLHPQQLCVQLSHRALGTQCNMQPSGKESLILSTDVQHVCVLNNYHSVALYVCLVNKVCAVTCILFY